MNTNFQKCQHCCGQMQSMLDFNEIGLVYISKYREYGLDYRDGGSALQIIYFCPWCGVELPKSLRNEWFDRLESIGIDPLDVNVPAKYTTSDWWLELQEFRDVK